MQGKGVLSPIGFDSFGLPAENAAIKTGTHPRIFTEARIAELKASLRRLGRRLRLAPGDPQPRPRVHEVEPGDLPAASGGRPGLPGPGPGQLVPRLPDRAGQRAGAARRHLRALRRRRRQARPRAVVLPHHRSTPTSCSRPSTTSSGPSGSRPCSATGSAGPRAPSSTCAVEGRDGPDASGSSPPGPTPASA